MLLENGRRVRLGSRALDILIALVERRGELVTKAELVGRVWQGIFVDEATLRVHISALRKTLGEGYISNIAGRGYCFLAEAGERHETLKAPRAEAIGNLPAPLTRMIGRTEVVRGLAELVPQRRFLTVVGPGGIGKTSVALAVAGQLAGHYRDGTYFVDLAPLSDPSRVPAAVAAALGLHVLSQDPLQAVLSCLQDKRILLVLDCCEHLIEGAASIAEEILRRTPDTHILATSREPLRADGEWVHRLLPLQSPPASDELLVKDALAFPTVKLFAERAMANSDSFVITDADVPVISEICRWLDGIPLAIELAAARVDSLTLHALFEGLNDRFSILTKGRRTALPRHKTLRAAVDWSYDLLMPSEQIVLQRLAILRGRFTLDAAAQIASCADISPNEVCEAVINLVSKSLIMAEIIDPDTRYRLLDTTRAYVLEKLLERQEVNAVSRRRAAYLCDFLHRLHDGLKSQAVIEPQIYREHVDNIRDSLEWCFSDDGDVDLGASLAAAASPVFTELSLLTECRHWAERSIATLAETARGTRREMELQASFGLSSMFTNGDVDEVRAALARGLELAERFDDSDRQLLFLGGLHTLETRLGGFAASLDLARRSRVVAAATGIPANNATADAFLGVSAHRLGDLEAAQTHCQAALKEVPELRRATLVNFGIHRRIRTQSSLAHVLWLRGFPDQAAALAKTAIAESERLEHAATLCISALWAVPVLTAVGDWAATEKIAAKMTAHAQSFGLGPHLACCRGFIGGLLLRRRQPDIGVELLCEALERLGTERHHMLAVLFAAEFAEGLLMTKRLREASTAIEHAIARADATADDFYRPELLRIEAEIADAAGRDSDAVEAMFQRSLDCARQQRALSLELRTAASFGQFRRKRGTGKEALAMVSSVYSRFDEGFSTAGVLAAKSLMSDLAEN
jgi:predicted ATPase